MHSAENKPNRKLHIYTQGSILANENTVCKRTLFLLLYTFRSFRIVTFKTPENCALGNLLR